MNYCLFFLWILFILTSCTQEVIKSKSNLENENNQDQNLLFQNCGETLHNGAESRIRYELDSVPFGSTCQSESQTRTCNNGNWSAWTGTFENPSCHVIGASSCGEIPHAGTETRTRYLSSSVPPGSVCQSEVQTKTCNNGTWSSWSGTYTQTSCEVEEASRIEITSHSEGARISSFKASFSGRCNDSYNFNVTGGSASVKIISSSCIGSVLNIDVGFKSSRGSDEDRSFTVTNGDESLTRTIRFRLDCPDGFIGVPGSSTLGTIDFCVAKYEMKAAQNDGTDIDDGSGWEYVNCLNPHNVANTIPESRVGGGAWVCINKEAAINECNSLDTVLRDNFDYEMISNSQWQTIARNIENNKFNWSNGSVGEGSINRGNSDDNSGQVRAAAANIDDGLGCFGLNSTFSSGAIHWVTWDDNPVSNNCGSGGWHLNKRTHFLSNGEVLWDLAGNVSEWVSDSDIIPSPNLSRQYWHDFDAYTCSPVGPDRGTTECYSATNRAYFGPLNTSFTKTHGMGSVYGSGYTEDIVRGAGWESNDKTGIYATRLNVTSEPSTNFSHIDKGFRCVSKPLSH